MSDGTPRAGFICLTTVQDNECWVRAKDIHGVHAEPKQDFTVVTMRLRISSGCLLEWYVKQTPEEIVDFIELLEEGQ